MDVLRPSTRHADLTDIVVLMVDDDGDILELLAGALESRNARVVRAENASEALAALRDERPDVIVSDIGLPDEDGCCLMERIRALPGELGGFTPAIALTSRTQESDRRRALTAGFWRHLSKPVDLGLLCAEISRLGRIRDLKRPF